MLLVDVLAAEHEDVQTAGWYPAGMLSSPAAATGGGGGGGPTSPRIEVQRICDFDRLLPRFIITFRNPPLRSSAASRIMAM